MRLYKYIILILFSLTVTNCNSQNHTKEEISYALNKLKEVEESDILDSETAYVIDLQKNKIPYSQFKGKWLLIDFWSTGCAPCIKEFPSIAKFHKKNQDSINVIAVSIDNKFERYKKSSKKYKIDVPHYYAGYTYENQLFNLNIKTLKTDKGEYKFRTMTPQYVLINPDGKIVDKDFPKPSSSDFKSKLNKALNEYK